MKHATFSRAGTGPRPFTIAASERIEEFTDYEAAKARFARLNHIIAGE